MRRPSFSVVISVVTILVGLGVLTRILDDRIPQPPANRLSTENAEYLQQAQRQVINWRPLNAEAFAEARRRQVPILLIIGASWSATGRRADRDVFTDDDVAKYLAHNFLSVRVDASEKPQWLNAYLPLTRASQGSRPGFQICFLDPSGNLFWYVAVGIQDRAATNWGFLAELREAMRRFEGLQRGTPDVRSLSEVQIAELNLLEQSGGLEEPDFSAQIRAIEALKDPGATGLNVLRPSAWRYLLIDNDRETFDELLNPIVHSPMVNWLDGGFFRVAGADLMSGVEYDQLAVSDAEMLRILALADATKPNPLYRRLAEATFDGLLKNYSDSDLLWTCRAGDEGPRGRSDRFSFSPLQMRQIFPDEADREKARRVVGLRVETNPQMIPYLTADAAKDMTTFDALLARLRKRSSRNSLRGRPNLAVNGFVAARLMEAALLWNDAERLNRASDLADRLSFFRKGIADVTHDLGPEELGQTYLGDYLAYADASLENYLAHGRVVSFEDGLRVLRRALTLFASETPGTYRNGLPRSVLGATHANPPEVIDTASESTTAQALRLCLNYSRLLSEKAGKGSLRNTAEEIRRSFSELAPNFELVANASVSLRMSGYYCSALEMHKDVYALAVGPEALTLSSRLASRVPKTFVAPLLGGLRPDLADQPAGIYLMSGETITGPLSVDEAALQLK